MGDLTRGIDFSDSAPGNQVTAARLHELVEGATLTAAAITGKTEVTSLESTDYFPVYDASANALRKVPYSSLTSSPVGLATFRNLVVKNNSGSPTTTIDVTADEVLMRDSNGVLLRAASVSVSANITTSGANGRDTGAEAASTWYYLWLISDGSTTASLLSTSATAPTMPNGYDYKARVGGVYNDGSSNFWTFQQNDSDYSTIRQANTLSTNFSTANNDPTSATGYNSLTLNGSSAPFVPVTAYRVRGYLGKTSATDCSLIIAATTAGLGAVTVAGKDVGTTVDGFTHAGFFDVPLSTAQTVQLKSAITSNGTVRIAVTGFKIKP